ncbi:MAG: glucose-6-phosphate isomerase family protein [Armatimonadota bacterium]|nr:glucose-6-phosphate isomerase family protein [Armatimonadota bacterium]MDR7445386.1 glucose-6-phosphate isomerase family protein [Armatimonadota bacterium]MDR7569727.1 glucose-6-phosphate isomerase family protein [Armatimonadota bacterium]MDR7614119.1 glucose-6-phosphate isomerase family protein [Armatimonadota bacterium]
MNPIRSELTWEPVQLGPNTVRTVRRASDLRGLFADAPSLEALVRAGDPVVYETYEPPIPDGPGHLRYGLTVLHPGRVGREYFMTRGHFHLRRETAEVYVPLRGRGVLVLQDEGGRCRVEGLHPGTVVYVPPGWAHRSVNTGPEPLVFLYVYPADAGHDYETVARTGFRVRVLAENGQPQVVPAEGP